MESTKAENITSELIQNQLDEVSLSLKLKNLKEKDFSDAIVNVYVVKVNTRNKEKRFLDIQKLKVHSDHKLKFKTYVTNCINGYEHISELRTINTNQDNRFFYVESSATDFSQIPELISSKDMSYIVEKTELNKYNAYAIQLTFGNSEKSVFAFRYISGAWSVNKTSKKYFGFETIKNELIITIDNDPRFQITPFIDFIQFGNDIFISDIKQFETAMNFHERLKEKKKEAIIALCASPAMHLSSKDTLSKIIGNDKYLMRQLASVHEKGYYANDIPVVL